MHEVASVMLLAACAALSTAAPGWPAQPIHAPCSAAVNGLIAGIEVNILAQQGERNATEALQVIEAQQPINTTAFAAGKAVLVNDIQFGMTIRRYNQLIASAGNAALPGLAKVYRHSNLAVCLQRADMLCLSMLVPRPRNLRWHKA